APLAGRWVDAARYGLADPDIRAGAVALLRLAAEHTATDDAARAVESAAKRCRHGRIPTEDDTEHSAEPTETAL
ncbi:ergothioneine biosynthesis glutamate--cysteine ligase EgtA, partial [Nocardia sp. NPDC019302]